MNLNGFYQTNNKSITNTSSSFSNTQSTPPKVNNTTNEFGNEVTFNQGIRLPAGTSIIIIDTDEEGNDYTEPLASTDLFDTDYIAYLDGEKPFETIPTFIDSKGQVHQFLINQPDTTVALDDTGIKLHATETTNTGGIHTTINTEIPLASEHFDQENGISLHRVPWSSSHPDDTFAKKSPYRAITGNDKGALIGRLITDIIFKSWVMGELSEDGDDERDETDKYKHGLVPAGAVYDGEAQQFLRKDGNWETISKDLFSITTDTATISDMGLNNTFAGFSHKDLANFRDCALLQSHTGKTMINSSTGQPINFTFNGVQFTAQFTATEAIFNVPMTIENAKISDMGGGDEIAGFAHKDMAGATTYALKQSKDGKTMINSANGKTINFRYNNVTTIFSDVNGLKPYSTNEKDLGTENLKWKNIYSTNGHIGNATISDAGWSKTALSVTMAVFSHEDRATVKNYAFAQHSGGQTYINSGDNEGYVGQVHVRTNNVNVATFTSTAANFTAPITTPDADTVHEFGRAKIGHVGSLYDNSAGFGHRDHFNTTSYGFLQGSTGNTLVNTPSGGTIFFRCNDDTVADFTATAANFSVPLEVGSIKILWDGNDTVIKPLSIWAATGSYAFKTDQYANNTTVHAEHTSNIKGNGAVIHVGNLSNGEVGVMMSHSITFSDSRLKTNQVDYLDGWDDFKTIKIKKYNRYGASETRIGVIADDIKIHPVPLIQDSYSEISGVTELSGVEYEDLGGVDYQILYRMNIAVTQQLMERVEALEAKIISLLDNA